MRILFVATKSPWPPRDGGRLALWLTMQSLAEAGHELALVAPIDAASQEMRDALGAICTAYPVIARRRDLLTAAMLAQVQRRAVSIVRHRLDAVERAVGQCIRSWRPQLLHVEQLQALANCAPAHAACIPIVLRMQNVESSLWSQAARARAIAWPLQFEAWRLRREEQRALCEVTRVVTLTERDALQLGELDVPTGYATTGREHHPHPTLPLKGRASAGRAQIHAVTAPFPRELASAESVQGTPAIALVGSGGWWPNAEGIRWFLDEVMPAVSNAMPHARAHVYGGARVARADVVSHAAPDDAMEAFPADAIVAIPLRIGSGIRMRILEAWARGLPVVATSVAAAGLHVRSGQELLIADDVADFVEAIRRLSGDATLRASLVAAGRSYLAQYHDPATVSTQLIGEYERALHAGET